MRNATLLFIVKKDEEGRITEVLLAMKKRGFGVGRWNGAGGKEEEGESIEETTLRETEEEIVVKAKNIKKIGDLKFNFPHEPKFDQRVHVYMTDEYEGEPTETEEMRPQWFAVSDIPYSEMWVDDIYWLPQVLEGKKVRGDITFGEGDTVLEHHIEEVESFENLHEVHAEMKKQGLF